MAGHMGNERVTVQNLQVIKAPRRDNLLMIKGLSRATKVQSF